MSVGRCGNVESSGRRLQTYDSACIFADVGLSTQRAASVQFCLAPSSYRSLQVSEADESKSSQRLPLVASGMLPTLMVKFCD
jgi:hypothetical protein